MFVHPLQHRSKRRGQAILEMAAVVIVLLFLTMGLIQFALIANARITLTNLAREGARFAAVHATEIDSDNNPDPAKGIKAHVIKLADATTLADAGTRSSVNTITVTISPAETSPPNPLRTSTKPIQVSVSYDMRHKFFLPVIFPGLANWGNQTTSSASMIIE